MLKLGNWFQKKINISAPSMREAVKAIEKDSKGNFWYLTNFFSPSGKIRND